MFSSIIATLAGSAAKVAVVTTVTAASVGGAYVSDAVDVPLLPDEPAVEEVVEAPEELAFEDVVTIEDESTEEEAAENEVVDDEVVVDETEEEANAADEDESDKPANHGSEVSTFVHTTELEGCEKGHAVAALASGKSEKADKECPGDSDDAQESEAADDDDDADHADDDDDADHDDDDDDADDDDDDDSQAPKTEKGNNGKKGDK